MDSYIFQRELEQSETQNTSPRIWTRVIDSISCADNNKALHKKLSQSLDQFKFRRLSFNSVLFFNPQ